MDSMILFLVLILAALTDPIILVGVVLIGLISKSVGQVSIASVIWGGVAIGATSYLYRSSQQDMSIDIAAAIMIASIIGSFIVWGIKRLFLKRGSS